MDYYEILEVSRNADSNEIKKAYRTMAKKYHPDKNRGDKEAEEKFKNINEAYQVLSDERKRASYDRYGKDGVEGENSFGFEGFGSIFEDIFDEAFGGGKSKKKKKRAKYNIDLAIELTIEFKEAIFGSKKEINYTYKESCTDCKGTGAKDAKLKKCLECDGNGQIFLRQGFMTFSQTCHICKGSGESIREACSKCNAKGFSEKEEKITIDIPEGIDNKNRLRVNKKGNEYNNTRGDLYITFRVKEDEHFIRDEDDIYLEIPVFFTQAIIGENIKIPSLKGELELKLNKGTRDKQQYVFKNEGVKNVQNTNKGSLIAQIKLVYPDKINDEQRNLLYKLQESFGIESKPYHNTFKSIFEKIKDWF